MSGPLRAFRAMTALTLALVCAEANAQTTYPASRSGRPPRDSVLRAGTEAQQVPAPPPAPVIPPSVPAPAIPAPPVPNDPIAPGVAPTAPLGTSAPAVGEGNATDLGIPRAGSAAGGGEPTAAEAAPEAAAEKPETTLLMKALGMEDSKLKIYGWLQNSYTGNANGRPKNDQNFGVNPNNLANSWQGNQYYLIFERPLEQNDTVNFGFRVDNLFGNDWTFNHTRGLFDTQNKAFTFAGYDPAQMYGEVHLPVITEGGLDIKGGRWYTLAGYEQVPAIARPLLSVPYMFNYGQPFTHVGALTTLHVTPKLNIYNGAINGYDRWIDSRYRYGYIGGFNYTFNEDKTNLAITFIEGPNQFPSFIPPGQNIQPTGVPITPAAYAGQKNYGYSKDNRFMFTSVLTHKWTDKLTQVLETDESWEYNIAFLGKQTAANPLGRKEAQWYSFGNWFLYSINDKLTGVWRSEVFWDPTGVRTGTTGGRFYEQTVGLIYKPKSWLWIRPEARYDWSQFVNAYSDGTRSSQLTLAFDVIFLF